MVAIIAVLAAILFPVFAQAKLAAQKTQCASNLRQIGIALTLYANDFDGRFPGSSHEAGFVEEGAWIFQLRPYVANTDEIRICPADSKREERLREGGTSYVLNEYIVVDGEGAQLVLDAMPRPSDSITTFTVADSSGSTWQQDHTHSRNWIRRPFDRNWRRILADIQPDRFRAGVGRGTENRTEGSANYLYADTHVRSHPAARVKGWADTNDNFALPPVD